MQPETGVQTPEMLVYCREAHFDVVIPQGERAYRVSVMQTQWAGPGNPDDDRYAVIILEPHQSTFLDLHGNAQRESHRMDQLSDWTEALQTGLGRVAQLELRADANRLMTHAAPAVALVE